MKEVLFPERDSSDDQSRLRDRTSRKVKGVLVFIALSIIFASQFIAITYDGHLSVSLKDEIFTVVDDDNICQQFDVVSPPKDHNLDKNVEFIKEHPDDLAEKLSGLIQIPSISYDVMDPVGVDPRWNVFYAIEKYLEKRFPRVHAHDDIELNHVNTHGLVYVWKGSDESLKPVMFMAHQDVVPVNEDTLDEWKYPPWSGYYDGSRIWGRGSSDCKLDLTARMEAFDLLIQGGFKPKRSIILAFGIDEESAGVNGAGAISKYLVNRFGNDSIAAIFDEGSGFEQMEGAPLFAVPSVAEKGYMDVNVSVHVDGGHSSVPATPHTAIGILSKLVTKLEDSKSLSPFIGETSVNINFAQCLSKYVPSYKHLNGVAKEASHPGILGASARKVLAESFASMSPLMGAFVRTTQAVDIFQSGFKANALPNTGWVVINYRIADHSSVQDVINHVTKYASEVSREFNLTLSHKRAKDFDIESEQQSLVISSFSDLEPSPLSPLTNEEYKLFHKAIKHVVDEPVIVVPILGIGNTDTQFMWPLTQNIYRFSPHRYDSGNAHSENEYATVSDLQLSTTFVHETIRLFDVAHNID